MPQALSGYRPRVSATASVGNQFQSTISKSVTPIGPVYSEAHADFTPHQVGVTATQTLYNGYQTANRTRQAEAQVSAGRATLAVTEEQILLNAATAYMNLLQNAAILDLQRRNVEVLQEQLRQTRDRFNVGEVTRTDVAQAESRLAAGAPGGTAGRTTSRRARPIARPSGSMPASSRPRARSTASRRGRSRRRSTWDASSTRRSRPRCSASTSRCCR